jgi:hypothetical protein
MRETARDLERLQRLINQSMERASPFLRASFEMPEHSLSAEQLCAHLQGSKTVALATATGNGEPRVAPIGALFVRAAFYVPTVAEAMRSRHVERRPAASLTYYESEGFAVIVHGQMRIIDPDHPDFDELDQIQVAAGRQSPREWSGSPVYLRFEADRLFTYAREPSRFPPTTAASD